MSEPNGQLTAERALELADDRAFRVILCRALSLSEYEEIDGFLRAFAGQQATIEELRVCGVVTGGSPPSISNSFLGDIDVCENKRPCADHPPEMIASLRSELDCAAEAHAEQIAERDETIRMQTAALSRLTGEVAERDRTIEELRRDLGVLEVSRDAYADTNADLRAALTAAEDKLKACEDYADLLSQAAQVYVSDYPGSSLTERVSAAAKKIRGEE